MWDVAGKQVRESFSSKKFLAILGLFVALSMVSVYMGIQDYQRQLDNFSGGTDYGPVPEKPSLIEIFQPLFSFNMPLTAGLLGLLLSYDYISKERSEGTIELLLSYPIYRDEIINGKLIAGIFTVATSILLALSMSSGLAVFMLGQIPSLDAVARLSFIWIGTVIYITFFLGLGTFLSTVFRSRWRSLIGGGLLLILFIGTPFLANIAAGHLYQIPEPEPTAPGGGGGDVRPLPGPEVESSGSASGSASASADRAVQVEPGTPERPSPPSEPPASDGPSREEVIENVMAKRENFRQTVSRISPATSFSNYAENMIGTSYSGEGLEPTFAGTLSSSFGYLIFLISQTALVLTGAYAFFLRQDL